MTSVFKFHNCFKPALWLFLVLIPWLLSCENRKETARQPAQISEKHVLENAPATSTDSLRLDVLAEFPPEMYGCSCYFSRNQQEFEKEQFIYVNDYAQTSVVSVNGKLTTLDLKSQSDSLAKETFYVYANEAYELKVTLQKSKAVAEEVSKMEGQLLLKELKSGRTRKYFYTGECGC